MKNIDFDSATPYFQDGEFKWYIEPELQRIISTEQALNQPALTDIAPFVVKGNDSIDYVLIDNNQNILGEYSYTLEGYGQMEAMINVMKFSKHFDDDDVQ